MSLLILSNRSSTALIMVAAADRAGLSRAGYQTNPIQFRNRLTVSQANFALITDAYLEDTTLFATIRAENPRTSIILCLTSGNSDRESLWAVLDCLEFDVVCTLQELPDCLTTLLAGRFYQSSLLRADFRNDRLAQLPGWQELTAAERRVVKLMLEGITGPQIAQALFISTKTVNNHKARISQKLNITGGPGSLTRFVLTHRDLLTTLLLKI